MDVSSIINALEGWGHDSLFIKFCVFVVVVIFLLNLFTQFVDKVGIWIANFRGIDKEKFENFNNAYEQYLDSNGPNRAVAAKMDFYLFRFMHGSINHGIIEKIYKSDNIFERLVIVKKNRLNLGMDDDSSIFYKKRLTSSSRKYLSIDHSKLKKIDRASKIIYLIAGFILLVCVFTANGLIFVMSGNKSQVLAFLLFLVAIVFMGISFILAGKKIKLEGIHKILILNESNT